MHANKFLNGGLFLVAGSILSAACSFARNIIVARLISVEDFGIAATFAMAMSLVEMVSNLSMDRFIVQAPDGDASRLIATAHLLHVVRGVIASLIMFLAAGLFASLFGIPHVKWAFQIVALFPLIRGFGNLDVARMQRKMRFGQLIWLDLGPQLITTALAAPLAIYFSDYRVMLAIVIGQPVLSTILSHLLSEKSYRWAWDRVYAGRILRFGWPIVLNGIMIFVIFEGDNALVAMFFSVQELGWYSAAFGIALAPGLVVVKVLQPFLMPLLASVQDDFDRFQQRATICVQLCLIVGTFVGVGFLFAGPATLLLAYGDRYSHGTNVIGILGVMQGFRIAKSGPAIVAMARAETANPLIANLVRSSGLLIAIFAVTLGYGVWAIAAGGIIGELLATITAILLLRLRLSLGIAAMLSCLLACTAVLVISGIVAIVCFRGTSPWVEAPVGSVLAVGLCGLLCLAFPNVMDALRRIAAGRSTENLPLNPSAETDIIITSVSK